jgi:hypothetical protein
MRRALDRTSTARAAAQSTGPGIHMRRSNILDAELPSIPIRLACPQLMHRKPYQ